MIAPQHPPTPEMRTKAKELLSLPEPEQRSFFLTTATGEYALKASPRGQQMRFRNWQRYLQTVADGGTA